MGQPGTFAATDLSDVDEEHEEWAQFAAHALAYAYSDSEPEYGEEHLISVNPGYSGSPSSSTGSTGF